MNFSNPNVSNLSYLYQEKVYKNRDEAVNQKNQIIDSYEDDDGEVNTNESRKEARKRSEKSLIKTYQYVKILRIP